MTELNLVYNYGKGRMNIRLGSFLDVCGVTRFKKLLKIIKMTDTPDEHINTIREYLDNNMPVSYEDLESNLIHYEQLVKDAQGGVDKLTVEIDRLKEVTKRTMKNGRRAKAELAILKEQKSETQQKLKNAREQLRHYKAVRSGNISDIKKLQKRKKDFSKYLEILKDV